MRVVGLMIVVCASAACGGEVQPVTSVSERDSAGVRIVEYAGAPEPTRAITLSPQPIYVHGDEPGDYLFQSIWVGALQPDGSAVVVDSGTQEIVRIALDGSSHSVLARDGQGPSEVRRAMSVFVLGQDTVLVEDDGNVRITVFEHGSPVRTTSTMGDGSLSRGLRAHGVAPNGDLLMGTSSYRRGFTEPWLPGYLVRFDPIARVADTVGSYDMVPFVPQDGSENPFASFGQVASAQGLFVVVRSDRAEIKWISSDGALLQIVRWNPKREYPSDADLDLFRASLRPDLARVNPQLGGDDFDRFITSQLARYEVVADEPLPLFGTLHGDDEGRVWLAHFDPARYRAGVPGYTVIGPDGEWLGVLESPESFRLLDVAGGRVLGIFKDDLDVEHVVVYELRVT